MSIARSILVAGLVMGCLAAQAEQQLFGAEPTAPPVNDAAAVASQSLAASSASTRRRAIFRWPVTLVESDSKKPLAGIDVEVLGAVPERDERQSMTLTSNEAGDIEIPLRAGDATHLLVKTPGWWSGGATFQAKWTRDANGASVRSDDTSPRSIPLWKGTVVEGQLLSHDGEPVGGVALGVGVYIHNGTWKERLGMSLIDQSWDHGEWPNWATSTTTAPDGSFSVTVPPSDARSWVRVGTGSLGYSATDTALLARTNPNHPLLCYAPFEIEFNGHDGARQDDEADGRISLGPLRLEKGVTFKGRVLDSAGAPLEGVLLMTSGSHGPLAGRSTVSRADGSFQFAPMTPATFTLTPDARLRNEAGEVISRDVQAVFCAQVVKLPELDDTSDNVSENIFERDVQAEPHVLLEFEWVDRRADKGPVSYYGEFGVAGFVARPNGEPVWWRGATETIERDGKAYVVVKAPRVLTKATLQLPRDQRVTASFEDDQTKSGPGQIPLGDITQPKRRIIYGDEPTR